MFNIKGWERIYQGLGGGKGIPSGGKSTAKKVRESKAIYPPETQGWAFLPLRVPSNKERFYQDVASPGVSPPIILTIKYMLFFLCIRLYTNHRVPKGGI